MERPVSTDAAALVRLQHCPFLRLPSLLVVGVLVVLVCLPAAAARSLPLTTLHLASP
jgi:hypothetical protein